MSYQIPSGIREAIMAEAGPLTQAVDTAAHLSFLRADTDCNMRPGEVDKVLSFFIVGLEFMEEEFNRRLHPRGVNVSISGIFTHQTPKVDLTTTAYRGKECELADLCVLATYGQPLARDGLGNAMLLQAKTRFHQGADPVQRALYEDEIEFLYSSPGCLAQLNHNLRQLPPKWEPALAYWEVGDWTWHDLPHYHRTWLYWANQVQRNMPAPTPFGTAVIDFLRGAGGYGFRRPTSGSRKWSRILFDLIEVTARTAVNLDSISVRDLPRGDGRLARRVLQGANTPGCPFVSRNSLAETLAFYSRELGELGRKIESRGRVWSEKLAAYAEAEPSRPGEIPPILGNDRLSMDGGEGGAGNLVFMHFTEE